MFPVLTPVHAQLAQHAPIVINSNDDFTSDNGVTSGSGTSDDPFMITGWNIECHCSSAGITIRNTDAHFIISDVSISFGGGGIVFNAVENGQVQNTHVTVASYAVNIYSSDNIQVSKNSLSSGSSVVFLNWSSSIDITDNTILGGAHTILGTYLSDVTITGNSGGAESGILLHHVDSILLSKNKISAHDPFSVDDCNNVAIHHNMAFASDAGISVSNCENVTVSKNTVQYCNTNPIPQLCPVQGQGDTGIVLLMSTDILVSRNNVTSNGVGISLLFNATGNTISHNLIARNDCGIKTDQSTVDQNKLSKNIFQANTHDYCTA